MGDGFINVIELTIGLKKKQELRRDVNPRVWIVCSLMYQVKGQPAYNE